MARQLALATAVPSVAFSETSLREWFQGLVLWVLFDLEKTRTMLSLEFYPSDKRRFDRLLLGTSYSVEKERCVKFGYRLARLYYTADGTLECGHSSQPLKTAGFSGRKG